MEGNTEFSSCTLIVSDSCEKMEDTTMDTAKKVFSNYVILGKLEKFLCTEDLKALRQVCKLFNAEILEKTSFISNLELVLYEEALTDPYLKTLSFCPESMKIIPFCVPYCTASEALEYNEINGLVCDLVQDCKSLTIWETEDLHSGRELLRLSSERHFEWDDAELPPHCPNVLDVVLSGRALERLVLNGPSPVFIGRATEKDAVLIEGVTELEWNSWVPTGETLDGDEDYAFYCPRLFLGLKKLKRICITTEGDHDTGVFQDPVSRQHVARLSVVYDNNRNTLMDRGAAAEFYDEDEGPPLPYGVYPALTTIRCFLYQLTNSETEEAFFLNHARNIQELDLELPSVNETDLRFVISKINSGAMPKLKKLWLSMTESEMGKVFFDSCMVGSFKDFDLEEFGFDGSSFPIGSPVTDVISSVPCRKKLKLLHLRGLYQERDGIYRRIPHFRTTKVSAKEFSNLTKLTLHSVDGVKNKFLRGIFRHAVLLKYLKLSTLLDITDDAFLDPKRKLPLLPNLQGLEYLYINELDITAETVDSGVRFPKLKRLTIFGVPLDASSIYLILAQNPSLRSVSLEVEEEEFLASLQVAKNEGNALSKLKRFNGRLLNTFT